MNLFLTVVIVVALSYLLRLWIKWCEFVACAIVLIACAFGIYLAFYPVPNSILCRGSRSSCKGLLK